MTKQNKKEANRLSLNKETIADLEMPAPGQDDVRGGQHVPTATQTIPTTKNPPPTKTGTIGVPPTKTGVAAFPSTTI